MSPIMEPDFDWSSVRASTPIYEKGEYELTIKRLRGSAWNKTDDVTGEIIGVTQVIRLTPEMVGHFNSQGELQTEKDGKEIAGEDCEDINLWLHSDGARKMSKRTMMAIAGYDSEDAEAETEFDEFLKNSGLDLSVKTGDNEDGTGLVLEIGDGWEELLVGKNVRAFMDVELYNDQRQQDYQRLTPINL